MAANVQFIAKKITSLGMQGKQGLTFETYNISLVQLIHGKKK